MLETQVITSSADLWAMASARSASLFIALSKVYGTLWNREHGDSPTQSFSAWASSLDEQQSRRVISRARELQSAGCKFPPALGELTLWATQPTDMEFFEIRARIMNGEHSNQIERWLVCNAVFNLKNMPEYKFMKSLREFYFRASELERQGKLFRNENPEFMLSSVSCVNLADKKRNDFIPEENTKRKVLSIVKRMRRSQQNQPVIDS